MSDLSKLKITKIDIIGNNYIIWAIGAKMHIRRSEFFKTIDKSKVFSYGKRVKIKIFLRHIHDDLKYDYIRKKDLADFCQSLKERLHHRNI